MKKRIKKNMLLILSVLQFVIITHPVLKAENADNRIWTTGSAYVLPAKRFEKGVFQPLKYGCNGKIEWMAHPLLFFVVPNISMKRSLGMRGGYVMAARHQLVYPTPLLRLISREGTGGIISPEFDIPHMLALSNEFLISKPLGQDHLLTGKAGLILAVKSGDLDERTTIDLPLIYSRMNVFYHGYELRLGGDIQGKLYKRLRYLADFDYFIVPGVEDTQAFEHKGLLMWNKSDKLQFTAGYKLVYGEYPFGTQWHLLIPVDVQFSWNRKR